MCERERSIKITFTALLTQEYSIYVLTLSKASKVPFCYSFCFVLCLLKRTFYPFQAASVKKTAVALQFTVRNLILVSQQTFLYIVNNNIILRRCIQFKLVFKWLQLVFLFFFLFCGAVNTAHSKCIIFIINSSNDVYVNRSI